MDLVNSIKFDTKKTLCFLLILAIHVLLLQKQINLIGRRLSDSYRSKKVKINIQKILNATQMVDSVKSKSEKKVETKYQSKEDNFFLRETKAKRVGSFTSGAKGIENGLNKITKESLMKSFTKKRRVNFGAKLESIKQSSNDKNKTEQALTKKGTRFGQDSEFGLSASNDFVEDLPLSDFSRINTLRSKYYGYFSRIKAALEITWGQTLREKTLLLYSRGSRMPASEHFITNLIVTMNQLGEIVKLHVQGMSGVSELDDAAVDAFNKAGPFPNPPKSLVKNGQVSINWGFVVKN